MLNENFGNAILKAMFGQGTLGSKQGSTSTYTPIDQGLGQNCYLALMTNRDQSQTLQSDTTYPAFSDSSHLPEEVIDKQYERILLGNLSYPVVNLMSAPSKCEISNSKFIKFNEFDPAPAKEVKHVITHIGLYSTETGGSAVYIGKLSEPVEATKGQLVIFRPKQITMSIGTDAEVALTANAGTE